jgi:glycosyltransferase involved in cell wall biosynthesis
MPSPARGRAAGPEVFINGRFFSQRVSGVQRYARETIRCLDELLADGEGRGIRWTLLVPRSTRTPALHHIAIEPVGRLQGHLWEQLELPWRARKGLLFSFGLTGPLAHRRQIVTVHDAAVMRIPQAYDWRFRLLYRFLVASIVSRSPGTIAVSRFSAGEATECYGAPVERVHVSTEGWQHLADVKPDEAILDRHGLRGRAFILAVSSPTPTKNFAAIVQALGILGRAAPPCAVAGSADPSVFRAAGSASDAMIRLGYVSDEELKALYQHASCFIFPSLYEGFGIPPLEAMSCGCPVLASTAAAVREVCGDAPLYFDPHVPEQLARRLREVLANPALRARMSSAGLERARLYSWMQSARLNLRIIREILCGI